jgi:predicted O-methyltransferase YrrM
MIVKLLIIILILLNIVFIYYINKKKIKSFIFPSKIKKIDVTEVHEIFKLNNISNNLSGPKKEAIVKSFSISTENNIVGMTSDYEAWIISSLSKISKNIFEFGTCSGKTTYLMALNSNENSKITTITLDPNEASSFAKKADDNDVSFRNIRNESIYNKFLFSNSDVEQKIDIIFQNSLEFNEKRFEKKMDLIFIDGGHTYSVVKNDTEKAFKMLNSDGIILWHDYVPGKRSSRDVVKYIDEISKNVTIQNIKNTSICYYKNNK